MPNMMHEFSASRMGYHHTVLVFHSLIETRAGMLPQSKIVTCHTTAVDDAGTGLFCTHDGVHLCFPVAQLQQMTEEVGDALTECGKLVSLPEMPHRAKYIGAQELTWDMHLDVPAVLRFLKVAEILTLLADQESLWRGGHTRRK